MIFGYGDFELQLARYEGLKLGLVLDTNVLISATYDLDPFHDEIVEFLDLIRELAIPLYCNVNVRAEFLEIHRRIIFTEALLDLARRSGRSRFPAALSAKLNSLLTRAGSSREGAAPLRLGEGEIKKIKEAMSRVQDEKSGKDAWTVFCETQIQGKLGSVWRMAEEEIGLNFLSMRQEDAQRHIVQALEWDGVVNLIERHGLSSSDAMILNMFLSSAFDALLTSDREVASSLLSLNTKKICFVPDQLKSR